ncbi:hypothetical protein AgCh_026472 [Apium graveolens]
MHHPRSLMEGFRKDIDDSLLAELELHGGKFTWERSRGKPGWLKERLDRCFATQAWWNLFPLSRKKIYQIAFLENDHGEHIHNHEDMCQMVKDYFIEVFTTNRGHSDTPNLTSVRCVTTSKNEDLVAELTFDEFTAAVKQMHPDKASGPDGLNPAFFQQFWSILGYEVFLCCKEWLSNCSFPANLNDTNVVTPIERALTFATKFPDKITDKTQLQRFLGSLNYVIDFYPNINRIAKPLHDRLKTNPVPWSSEYTEIVRQIKAQVLEIPCLHLADPNASKVVETYASELGYNGILKQVVNEGSIPVALIFRIHYKAIMSIGDDGHKNAFVKGETILLQTDLSRSNTVIPRSIKWHDISLPTEWVLEGVARPRLSERLEPNIQIHQVHQDDNERVTLVFDRSSRAPFISSRYSDASSRTLNLGRIS